MLGTTEQLNTEAQLAFIAEDAHSKDGSSKNGTDNSLEERETSASSKFALRNPSIQNGNT
eukprot:960336-Ditylum_brightwellii.AAC.1